MSAVHPNLLAQLKVDEGKRDRPYRDTRGYWTVGYGHNLETGAPLSEAAMTQILLDDVTLAQSACEHLSVWASLNDPRRAVLVNMAFNLGIAGLLSFHDLLGALARADYADASEAMRQSTWAAQVPARAQRLATQMETGVWQ